MVWRYLAQLCEHADFWHPAEDTRGAVATWIGTGEWVGVGFLGRSCGFVGFSSGHRDLKMPIDAIIKAGLMANLERCSSVKPDRKGYVTKPEENLIEGIKMDLFEHDLRKGDGDELRMKFCATHSSAALVVNCFAWFNGKDYGADRMKRLKLLGMDGAKSIDFEHQLQIFDDPSLKKANLDVWVEFEDKNVAIESKLMEYFTKKKPDFSEKYGEPKPRGLAEPCWWEVLQRAKRSGKQHLDVAQLVKHYLGIRRWQTTPECKPVTLLYLFWEPTDWENIDICKEHRKQVAMLAQAVATSTVKLESMSYLELWNQWGAHTDLKSHVSNLKSRYAVSTA